MPAVELTWLGHATVLIEDRARVLTDPILTSSLLHLRRRAGPRPQQFSDLIDAVVISHLHSDHLHLPSLGRLHPGTRVLIPRGGAHVLDGMPLDVVEVTAGDIVEVAGARVAVVPAIHSDQRWPFSRQRAAPVGYVVQGDGTTYFAGDTSAFPGMREIEPRPDVAVLPVGGWGPWLRGEHMHPDDAAGCLPLLDAPVAVPVHYGTFWPRGISWVRPRVFHEPGREFAEHAARIAPEVDVRVLAPGESTTVQIEQRRSDPAGSGQ